MLWRYPTKSDRAFPLDDHGCSGRNHRSRSISSRIAALAPPSSANPGGLIIVNIVSNSVPNQDLVRGGYTACCQPCGGVASVKTGTAKGKASCVHIAHNVRAGCDGDRCYACLYRTQQDDIYGACLLTTNDNTVLRVKNCVRSIRAGVPPLAPANSTDTDSLVVVDVVIRAGKD